MGESVKISKAYELDVGLREGRLRQRDGSLRIWHVNLLKNIRKRRGL